MSAATGGPQESWLHRWRWALIGVALAVAVVVILAPAASSDPDGLDRVSGDKGFHEEAKDAPYEVLPDYTIPGIDNEWLTVVLAGVAGVGMVLALTMGVGYVLKSTRGAGRPHPGD